MRKIDRWLFHIWVAATVGAACAVLFQGIAVWLLMLSIIGIPVALLLPVMPGLWIYLTPTLAIYAALRKVSTATHPLIILGSAMVLPLIAGFLIPRWANAGTDERINALLADDHGAPPTLPVGLSITHAIDQGLGSSGKCWELCQRILLSRTAKSVVEVPIDKLPSLASLPIPVHRYSLGPVGERCNHARLKAAYATSEETGRAAPLLRPPLLWDKLYDLQDQEGLCLHDDAVQDARSDILVVERRNYDPAFRGFQFGGKGWRLTLHPIEPFKRREVFRRTPTGMVRLMRRTNVRYAHLAEPLWITPAFTFDISTPTHWTWTEERVAGMPVEKYKPTGWTEIIANDLSVHGLR